jgi:hypothetical protein
MRSFFRHEFWELARSPLSVAALPSMSLILSNPFTRLRLYGAAGEFTLMIISKKEVMIHDND